MARWCTGLLAFVAVGCSEYDLKGEAFEPAAGVPAIRVRPAAIDFGELPAGTSSDGFFSVENVGDATLTLGTLSIDGAASFELNTAASGLDLEPGDTVDGMVTYHADAVGPEYGQVLVPSNDPAIPQATVQLAGGLQPEEPPAGPERPVVVCSVDPTQTEAVIGSANLIGDQSYDPGGLGLTYTWNGVARPASSLATIPGGVTSTDPNRTNFVPDVVGTYGFELVVTNDAGLSSDPCYVELVAVAPVIDKPIAVCSVNPPVTDAVLGSADLIGDLSFDPAGFTPLTYTWTVAARPPGSTSTIPGLVTSSQPNRFNFVPDLVGWYDFQLVVTNSMGVASDPCITQLEAVPAQDLWVEMFWTHSGDDMDLHLTRNGGALVSNQDCYYGNCVIGSLDWGPGGVSGNPSLDLDDIPGTGPENINVTTPENTIYNVYVHDYPGSVYNGSNPVTVNIYLSGVLAWSDTKDVNSEGSYVFFADVDWAAQTVTP